MTKHAYQQSVFSGSDAVAVAPFAQITVTNADDDSAASIWEDANGTTPISDGVLLADENGYFIFYADEGTYNIAILSDGISKTLSNVEIGAGNPYSGIFRGTWDMSSGTTGPAAPATDYQSTHTGTTITPDASLTYGGPSFWPSTASSDAIPVVSGTQSASVTRSNYVSGDTVSFEYVMLANSSASPHTFSDILQGVALTVPTYFVLVGFSRASGLMIAYAMNNDSPTMIALSASSVGDVASIEFDGTTATIKLNGAAKGTFAPAVGSFPVGDGLRLFGGTLSTAASVVFSAGHATVDFSGYQAVHDADLPVGALDNDWYEVTAGGYFHGKTTRAGQYVKLISGKTNLIVVDKPADPGTAAVEAVTVTHFADINTAGLTEPRLFVVDEDETNNNQRTPYLFDGSALMWLVALEA